MTIATLTPTAVTTWADAYGVWHVKVPDSGDPISDESIARSAILAELRARYGSVHEPSMTVKRVKHSRSVPGLQVKSHEFVEVWS